MPIKIVTWLFILLLSGCAHYPQGTNDSAKTAQQHTEKIAIAEGVTLSLSHAPAHLIGQHFQHLLAVTYQGNKKSVLMQVQITEQQVDMVAVSLQGIPLFEMTTLADGRLTAKNYVNLSAIKPAFIMADFQLVYWPIETLNKSLIGATISEEYRGNTIVRKLNANNKTVVEIALTKMQVRFNHLTKHYQLFITPIES